MKHSLLFVAVAAVLALVPAVASAGPVATSDGDYQALGRVFPDPQGACNSGPCSPRAQGNAAATSFIGYQEFVNGLRYMNDPANGENSKAWSRYLEVWTLDGDLDGNATTDGKNDIAPGTTEKENFPGDNLGSWEFKPDGRAHSAGLPTSDLGRLRSDVFVLRVTDESVPDKDKKRMALSLSIHGIERAGVEGGTRAMEDLVTAVTTGRLDDPILTTKNLGVKVPTFKDVLQHTIIYFTYPNPDGWRRGDLNDQEKGPGAYYQRYNGNGVDVNRDFPDIGFAFRPYSGLSEPESRGWASAFQQIKSDHGAFAAGDDLHGQLGADSFSYTLMPHGSHDYAKNERIREAAQSINLVQQDVLSWSPLIQPNDQPRGSCNNKPVVGADCYPMYGQNWGTVYDTINYTTTGALGDFMDSSIGLNADGIDNEMSYSHLDKDVAFEPVIEQMHVDGNKGLIYAHLARILNPRRYVFPAKGVKGYVANRRVKREAKSDPNTAPPGTKPQDDIDEDVAPDGDGNFVHEFPVKQTAEIYNGGLRVDVTNANVQGVDPTAQAGHSLVLECKGCDRHRGIADEDDKDWTVIAEDFNQSGIYAQAGLTVAANDPQPTGGASDTKWRAKVEGALPPQAHFHVEFSKGPATSDGATGGDAPPRLAGYDVASTDFWEKLNPFTTAGNGFEKVDPGKLARDADAQVPAKLDSLILSDQPLPGYSFPALPKVEVPADVKAESQHPTAPCGYSDGMPHTPNCGESFDFKIEKEGLGRVSVVMTPTSGDLTLTVTKVADDGTEEQLGATSDQGGDAGAETIDLAYPDKGNYRAYVDNFLAPASGWTATVHYEGPSIGDPGDASTYTDAEWERYAGKLAAFAKRGGNLVLTDGAVQALPYLFDKIKRVDVTRNISYVGQVAFTKQATDSQEPDAEGNTLSDPLAKNIKRQGARFNSGLRRQTYEPTPIGFAIQDKTGGDANSSPQWVVERKAFEAAGGRITATGTSGEADLVKQVTVGELKLGKGVVRIIGALLPQPTEKFDHQEGLEPFAVTYSGYSLVENLTDYCAPGHNCVKPRQVAGCLGRLGFKRVVAAGRNRRVRFSVDRLGTAPVRYDVFQVSHGRHLFHERRITKFTSSKANVTWNGRGRKHRRVTDGYYVVRFLTKTPTGHTSVHRIALQRRHGRWRTVRDYQRRARCGTIRLYKLSNPVFGGTRNRRLKAGFRLSHAMPAQLTVTKGKRVVYRKRLKRARGGRYLRFKVPLEKPHGLYKVTLVAGSGKSAARAKLYSRRL